MKMSVEHWWNDADGKTEVLGEKCFPVPICVPEMSHGLT
jgi:hypothetical protein